MISITRQTRQGWKTYLYETEAMFQVGRPHVIRHATLEEMREPNEPFQLDENGSRKKKEAWRKKKGKSGSKARLEKRKGERATSEFHGGKVITAPAGAYGNEDEKKEGEVIEQDEKEEKAVKTSENEGGAKNKWSIKDFSDQIEEWKKAGYTDESKLQGMIDKATGIAKKSTESAPGKATRAEVLGILQGFFQKKG